jgi:hypothetical protein
MACSRKGNPNVAGGFSARSGRSIHTIARMNRDYIAAVVTMRRRAETASPVADRHE